MNSWDGQKIMNFIIEFVKPVIRFAIHQRLYLISTLEVPFQEC